MYDLYAYEMNDQQAAHISECIRTDLRRSDMQYFVRAGTCIILVVQYLIHLPSSGSIVTVDPRPRPALFRAFTCS